MAARARERISGASASDGGGDDVKRWVINLLCALSMLIWLLTMGILVRSYCANDKYSAFDRWRDPSQGAMVSRGRAYGFAWSRGAIGLDFATGQGEDMLPPVSLREWAHYRPW